MNSTNKRPALDSHRYILWNDVTKSDDGSFLIQTRMITLGSHGMMNATPDSVRMENSDLPDTGDVTQNLIEHNLAELKRARSEGRKWDQRMRDSPLGKTQQDYVAYYTSVVALFTKWIADHGIPISIP